MKNEEELKQFMLAHLRQIVEKNSEVQGLLMGDFERCMKDQAGTLRMAKAIDESIAEDRINLENIAKQTSTALKAVSRLADMNQRFIILLVTYMSGSASSDAVSLMNTLGHGEEGLRAMWNQKLKGGK